jgi:integrase
MGSIYQPKLKSGERCSVFWLKYYANGKCIRVSSGTDNEQAAKKMLKEREGRAAMGQPILPRADRVSYTEIAADLRSYYATTGKRQLVESETRLKHLDTFFSGYRAVGIDRPTITRYVQHRQQQGASNGTINRELATLGRMLNLAVENGRLLRVPSLRGLKPAEAAPRQGFFERDQFEAVCRHLPADLQVAASVAYTLGWRMQSEVLSLERRHLDLEAGTLRLDPGMTKNTDGRVAALPADLLILLADQAARVSALEREFGHAVPWLFPHLPGRVSPALVGTQRRDFRRAWAHACKVAGVPGRLRHDLRRTAVRNMVSAGVPERVAMTITGHRTRSVFDRYHIVSENDLREAARKLDRASEPTEVIDRARSAGTFGK